MFVEEGPGWIGWFFNREWTLREGTGVGVRGWGFFNREWTGWTQMKRWIFNHGLRGWHGWF